MIRTGKGLRMPKGAAIRLLTAQGWTVKNGLSGRQSAILAGPNGREYNGKYFNTLSIWKVE